MTPTPEIDQVVNSRYWLTEGKITLIREDLVVVEFTERDLVWEEDFDAGTFMADWAKGDIHLAEQNKYQLNYGKYVRSSFSAWD